MNYPKIHLQTIVVLMWKPMAANPFIYIGFLHVQRLCNLKPPQVFHPKMHENVKNSKNNCITSCESPTLLSTTKGGQSSYTLDYTWMMSRSNMSSTKHVSHLGINWYAFWITSNGVRLVHIHWNQWECEPIDVAFTYISSPIQTQIWCHFANIVG
jgi:hypothetical protein